MSGALYESMFVVERSSTGSEISWRLIGLASFLMLAARPGRGDSDRSVAVLSARLTRLVNARARDMLVDGGEIEMGVWRRSFETEISKMMTRTTDLSRVDRSVAKKVRALVTELACGDVQHPGLSELDCFKRTDSVVLVMRND